MGKTKLKNTNVSVTERSVSLKVVSFCDDTAKLLQLSLMDRDTAFLSVYVYIDESILLSNKAPLVGHVQNSRLGTD